VLATRQRFGIRSTVLLFILAVVGFPLAASFLFENSRNDGDGNVLTPAPSHGVVYPADFESRFIHYATVQRPDGTIRDLFISPASISAFSLPSSSVLVITNHYAKRDEDNQFVIDDLGRYIRDEAAPMIHVREKRADWLPEDFVSALRSGDWNFGSFDAATGEPFDESISACFNCHNASRQPEFLFSNDLLQAYRATGETQYLICEFTGRTECSFRS
jgi:hypothetical protein